MRVWVQLPSWVLGLILAFAGIFCFRTSCPSRCIGRHPLMEDSSFERMYLRKFFHHRRHSRHIGFPIIPAVSHNYISSQSLPVQEKYHIGANGPVDRNFFSEPHARPVASGGMPWWRTSCMKVRPPTKTQRLVEKQSGDLWVTRGAVAKG